MLHHGVTVLLEYIDRSVQFSINIHIYIYPIMHAGIMLNAFNDSLCSNYMLA